MPFTCIARNAWRGAALRGASCALLLAASAVGVADEPGEGPALDLSAGYTGDLRRNTSGGMAVGTAYANRLDLGLTWNTSAFGGNRVTSNLAVMYLGGEGISGELVGDLQGVNNIEAPSGWRLYESWVEIAFGEHSGSLRAGVLDVNAEFDTPVTQGLFIASPFGVGTELSQTGVRGPGVWPTTGLGVRASGLITDGFTWRLGAYDGAPGTDDDAFTSLQLSGDDGALLIGEIEYSSGRVHKAALGGWAYTAPFERIDSALLDEPESEHGNQGFYATFDMALGVLGGVNFDGALRAGKAPARFNTVDRYVGAAVSATQLWESRPGDALGLGVAYAHVGSNYQAVCDFDGTPATSSETVVELVYRAELAPWVSLVPNVQFVNSPGALHGVDDSWILGLRFELATDHSWALAARRGQSGDGSYARRSPPALRN